MLVGIEGKDLGPKFFLEIDLGVLEGQISGGSFSDSIFDPSVIGATAPAPKTTSALQERLIIEVVLISHNRMA